MKQLESLPNLKVEVSARLCRLRMPVEVVANLDAGDALELPRPPGTEPSVDLKVAGKPFARAKIVQRDGRLFAELTELSGGQHDGAYAQWQLTKRSQPSHN